MPPLLGPLAALASALAWAVGSILFRKIGERASPAAMNLAKGLLGLVVLGLVAPFAGLAPIPGESLARLVASGVLGIAVGDTLFFMALVRLDPRLTLLLATVGHVFTVLLAVLLLGERPGALAWVGMALVLGGASRVMWEGTPADQASTDRRVGIVCGIGSALATSSALLLAKTGVEDVPTVEATWVRLAAGVVAVAVVSAARGELGDHLAALRLPGFVREIGLAVAVVMLGGFWLSLVALKYTDASIATILAAAEPIFVLPLARVWLGDKVGVGAALAAVVATVGVGLILAGT